MSETTLDGRVAIVTGGARGIGLAVARTLHARGASVIIADNGVAIDGSGADPSVAAAAVAALGDRAVAWNDDVSGAGAGAAMVALAVERFGAVDIVVNNAAILRDALIFKGRPEDFDRVLKVDLHAPFVLIAAATAAMRDQIKAGRAPGGIVNMVSSAGLIGNFGQSAYASAKAGLLGLTRVVAMDMARAGVRCNAVAPFAATRVTESIRPANDAQVRYRERALRIPADHVARLVAFLVSAGNTFTGQVFGVRGREVFLFSQPRVAATVVAGTPDRQDETVYASALASAFGPHLTDLATDLERFDTEPEL